MSRIGHASAHTARFRMPPGSRFALHRHEEHQLTWVSSGVLVVECDDGTRVLPPSRALWIPGHVRHAVEPSGSAVMESLYVPPDGCPVTWSAPTPIVVGPLLAALISHLGDDGLAATARQRAVAVVYDLLRPATSGAIHAPLPREPRALSVAERLRTDPADRRSLDHWAESVHVSARTLARDFQRETGLTFGRWRRATRLQAALLLLADGEPVGRVAAQVGYDTASAFVAAFRRHTGTTPGAYFAGAIPRD